MNLYKAKTVILASVIASFVFGMAGTVEHPRIVSINVQKTNTTQITLTNYGGNDAAYLTQVAVKINGEDPVIWTGANAVGATKDYESADGVVAGQNHVIITGTFSGGKVQVLTDTYI